jgi:hypothetical protein
MTADSTALSNPNQLKPSNPEQALEEGELLTYVAAHAGPGVGCDDDALVEDEGERGRAPLILHHVLGGRLEPVELLGETNTRKESAQKALTDPDQGEGTDRKSRRMSEGIGFSRRRSWGTPWLACRRRRRRRGGRRLRRRGRRTGSQEQTCPASSWRRRRCGTMDRVRRQTAFGFQPEFLSFFS